MPTPEDFELATADVAPPGPGEVQVKNLWMSVDPYMRGRMTDRESYVPPFELGKALQGGAVGEVTASNDPNFKPGDLVSTMLGWREGFTAAPAASGMQKIETYGLPPQAFLGVAGMPGLTAYVGLLKIGLMKEGETVFVSAAAGAVGQIVCQIAKIKGGVVIGTAGGEEKCAYLKEIGVDHVIDYKAEKNLIKALAEAAPKGVDVYFDNVGGDHLEAALNAARPFGRLALCGAISMYNETAPVPGPSNLGAGGGQTASAGGLHRLLPLRHDAGVREGRGGVGSGRQAALARNHRRRDRKRARRLHQAVQRRKPRQDAGEARLTKSRAALDTQ